MRSFDTALSTFCEKMKNICAMEVCIFLIFCRRVTKWSYVLKFALYNKLIYAHILIGSHLWYIRGQTSRLRHHYYILFLYYIKQIDSTLPCVCSVKDHRTSKCGKNKKVAQNVVRANKWHTRRCSYNILTSSLIYYWTDARQRGMYLLNCSRSLVELNWKDDTRFNFLPDRPTTMKYN